MFNRTSIYNTARDKNTAAWSNSLEWFVLQPKFKLMSWISYPWLQIMIQTSAVNDALYTWIKLPDLQC